MGDESSLPSYDADETALLIRRNLGILLLSARDRIPLAGYEHFFCGSLQDEAV